MLVACQLVNLTTWTAAEPVFHELRRSYPTQDALARAPLEAMAQTLAPLGLYNRRAKTLTGMAQVFSSEVRTSDDVMRLPGCGKYAADSWALFIEKRDDVEPNDGKLNWYVRERKVA